MPAGREGASRRLIVAGVAGNVMEWYDFAVYGYFAQTIGAHFFPSKDPVASLIAAFGVFAAGFMMRPVGGLVFGPSVIASAARPRSRSRSSPWPCRRSSSACCRTTARSASSPRR